MPSGPETRCSPLCLTDVIRLLPPAARTRIQDIGHGKLLEFKLDGLSSRVLLGEFMSRGIVHDDDIEIPVGDTSIWITRKVVEDALPLPSGSIKELPKLNDAEKEEANKEYNKMFGALVHVLKREKQAKAEEEAKGKKGKGKRVKGNQESQQTPETQPPPENQETQNATPVNQEEEEEEEDPADLCADYKRNAFKPKTIKLLGKYFEDKEVCDAIGVDGLVRLFYGVVVDRLLLPSKSNVVTAPRLQQLHNLDKLKEIDWAHLVFKELQEAVLQFEANSNSMKGCVALLLVVLVDCIKGNCLNLEESNRMTLYTEELINSRIQENEEPVENIAAMKKKLKRKLTAPKKKVLWKSLNDIEFMKFEDSFYGQSIIKRKYKKYVSVKTRDGTSLDFEGHKTVPEHRFIDCFKDKENVCDLLKGETKSLDHITEEMMKEVKLVCVHDGQRSMLIDTVKEYFKSKHNMDFSKHQTKKWDCGFHVLLYIKGFEKMDIYDITKKKILAFRQELSMWLLFHTLNRRNPDLIPPETIVVDQDTSDDEDSETDSFKVLRSCRPKAPEPSVDKEEEEEKDNDDDSTEKMDVDDNGEGEGKIHGSQSSSEDNDTVVSPSPRRTKRRKQINVFLTPTVDFKEHRTVKSDICVKVYNAVKEELDLLVLIVGGTSFKSPDLIKFLDGGECNSAPKFVNAFIHCVKWDDVITSYHNSRLIFPVVQTSKDISKDTLQSAIKEGLGTNNGKKQKWNKQRFLVCPVLQQDEWFVYYADLNEKKVFVLHSNNCKNTTKELETAGEAFRVQLDEAFQECNYISPFANKDINVSLDVFHVNSKHSVLGCMLAVERYNGVTMPRTLKPAKSMEQYKAEKLGYLIFHEENTADVPADIEELRPKKKRG
ncbi:hypothetical protein ACP4OV_014693 [Aristida adscensionis]